MKTATVIAKHLDGWKGRATLYRLDPPVEYDTLKRRFFGWIRTPKTEYVIVSATAGPEGDEAFIFPCDHTGKVKSFLELHGSRRGTLVHEEVLLNMGYLVVT